MDSIYPYGSLNLDDDVTPQIRVFVVVSCTCTSIDLI